MSQILETIIEFITSEKVAYVISLIGALYIPVQGIVSKITNKKLNKKIQNKQTLLQIVKDEYQKYATNAEVIVNNLSTKYIEAEKTIEKITDILKKQSEAMTIAFNNSNLNASAKKLVEETLKIVEDAANNIIDGSITEDENKKDGQIPISNAVKEVVEEKENEKEKLSELNNFKYYFKKRILYFIGFIFLYIFPTILIFENLFVLKKSKLKVNKFYHFLGV